MREHPSPNFSARPEPGRIDMLILHYTGMESARAALERLCDGEAASRVSAHYLIDEDGAAWRLVEESARAWHAGVSSWRGATGINDRSIGIELVNPGHEFGYRRFPEAQMTALIGLGRAIIARHGIAAANILGHSDVAPQRKQDPGELFDWRLLAEAGIGTWPEAGALDRAEDADQAGAPAALEAIGYDLGHDQGGMAAAVTAFQRRYRPGRIDGAIDGETAALIHALDQ